MFGKETGVNRLKRRLLLFILIPSLLKLYLLCFVFKILEKYLYTKIVIKVFVTINIRNNLNIYIKVRGQIILYPYNDVLFEF